MKSTYWCADQSSARCCRHIHRGDTSEDAGLANTTLPAQAASRCKLRLFLNCHVLGSDLHGHAWSISCGSEQATLIVWTAVPDTPSWSYGRSLRFTHGIGVIQIGRSIVPKPCSPLYAPSMAAKPHAAPQDNTGSSFLAQFPPPISLASPVLASVIPLPDQPLIAYSVFTGASATNTSDQLNLIEIARRRILERNANHTILDSLLPSVYISKDLAVLYVFAFCSTVRTSESHVALLALQFDGLVCEYLTSSASLPEGVALEPVVVLGDPSWVATVVWLHSGHGNPCFRAFSPASEIPWRMTNGIRFHWFISMAS